MQTGECGAELGYRFLVTDTASVVRLAGISSLLASARGGGGGVGCQRQRFLCQKFYACLVVWSLFLPS